MSQKKKKKEKGKLRWKLQSSCHKMHGAFVTECYGGGNINKSTHAWCEIEFLKGENPKELRTSKQNKKGISVKVMGMFYWSLLEINGTLVQTCATATCLFRTLAVVMLFATILKKTTIFKVGYSHAFIPSSLNIKIPVIIFLLIFYEKKNLLPSHQMQRFLWITLFLWDHLVGFIS